MIPSRERLVLAVERRVPDRVGDWLSGDLSLSVSEVSTPPYVVAPETVSVVRFHSDLDMSRYVTGVPAAPRATYELAPERPFSRVELPVIGVTAAETIRATATFESAGGRTESDEYVVQNDETFSPDDRLEVSLEAGLEATTATVTVGVDGTASSDPTNGLRARLLRRLTDREFVASDRVRVGVPVPHGAADGPPVVLISIDTLRWDRQAELSPLIEALGGREAVVEEPRTMGHWTPPSHGCMFTGVHPGDHEYVGLGEGSTSPINPALTTLGDVLHDRSYKTRGLVSHTRILPEAGFGHGFFQYRLGNMGNWLTREYGARNKVETMIDWIDRDCRTGDGRGLFYFLHVFDPHLPYVPPLPDDRIDSLRLDEIEQFRSTTTAGQPSYLKHLETDYDLDPELVDRLCTYYDAAVEHTAEQIARLIDHLKRRGLFEDALIVVTGDHGEEFGEQGLYGHDSLYDGNVRPFMAVKPPADADWSAPDVADTTDILPTIAETLGASVPGECQGRTWQTDPPPEVRVAERIRPDWYNVAVEIDGAKAVYTYEENYPDLPTEAAVEDGPVRTEYYRRRDGVTERGTSRYESADLDSELRDRLSAAASDHALRTPIVEASSDAHATVTQDTEERLEHLGYR